MMEALNKNKAQRNAVDGMGFSGPKTNLNKLKNEVKFHKQEKQTYSLSSVETIRHIRISQTVLKTVLAKHLTTKVIYQNVLDFLLVIFSPDIFQTLIIVR